MWLKPRWDESVIWSRMEMFKHCRRGSTQSYWVSTWDGAEKCILNDIPSSLLLVSENPCLSLVAGVTYKLLQEDRQTSTGFGSQPALFQQLYECHIHEANAHFLAPLQYSKFSFQMAVQRQLHQQAPVFIYPTKDTSAWPWNISIAFLITIPRIMQLEIYM